MGEGMDKEEKTGEEAEWDVDDESKSNSNETDGEGNASFAEEKR
jgi:hypothetical protein